MTDNEAFVPSWFRVSEILEQYFDTAFASPDGIARLRELILTLAMQGRLVEQDPDDPPASELLREIEAEKRKISHEGTKTRRKDKKLPPIKPEEVPYELPQGWEWVRLGEIAVIERGGSPRPIKAFITDDLDGLNWIKIGDTDQGGKYITSTNEKIRPEGLVKTRMVYPGDFLLTNSMSFGRPYITKIRGCIHDGWLRIGPPDSLDKDYLYCLLSSSFIRKMFDDAAAGAVVSNLNSEKVRELYIPLPPLPEQHRIVARIDQLMARCDELEKLRKEREEKRLAVHAAAIKQLLDNAASSDFRAFVSSCEPFEFLARHFGELYTVKENVAELRKAILQLAVMGRLVEQDPNDPPASELLKEIDAEKQRLVKAGKVKKPKPLPPIKPEEVPYELPQGWEWVALQTVGFFLGGKTPSKNKSEFWNGDIPWVSPKDMKALKIQGSEDHVTVAGVESGLAIIPEQSILMVVRSGILRRAFPVSINKVPCTINQDLKALVPYQVSTSGYLLLMLRGFEQFILEKLTKQGVTVESVKFDEFANTEFPLPPLPEQHRIVDCIDQLMAMCDALEQQIDAATGKQTELLNAVMAQV